MNNDTCVQAEALGFSYGDRKALDSVSFRVDRGQAFCVLGPNGGGKTTLFRILATLATGYSGTVSVLGCNLATDRARVRKRLGVVFQSPSVDPKLTVGENLRLHAALYAIDKQTAVARIGAALERLGLAARVDEFVETLSGGLKRRVELAKCLLSEPEVLILDEPSTGLDPGARRDLWTHLESLRTDQGVSVLVTTHLMDEAERCDAMIILDHGRVVAEGSPASLRGRIGGDVVTVRCSDPEGLAGRIRERLGASPTLIDGSLRIEQPDGHLLIKKLIETFPEAIDGVSLAKPTLEDVFIHETGHRFWNAG